MEINRDLLLQSFREETGECLVQMEQLLLGLETRPEDRELLSSLFRVVHTMKGNASLPCRPTSAIVSPISRGAS